MDIKAIYPFWADEYFGCTISDMENSQDIVCPHQYLKNYHGIFIMKINNKFIVSSPKDKVAALSKIANRGLDLFDLSVLQSSLKEEISKYIGPCWIGYASYNSFDIPDSVMIFTKSDPGWISVFEDLQQECDDTEWSHSGITENSDCIAVQYKENKIIAAASYSLWGKNVAHIGVISHPNFRNQGFAKNVISSITKVIKEQGLIPQYRTLCTNISALKAAKRCGFEEFAYHISVRLQENLP